MATPSSALTPYCTAAQLLDYFDARAVADLVKDSQGSPPTRAQLLDTTDRAGYVLNQLLLAASGLVEAACTQGKRYTPTELGQMTGASKGHLQRLTAGLTYGGLMERRMPIGAVREKVPAVAEADKMLERLRLGEHCFGLEEQQNAGAGIAAISFIDPNATADNRTVLKAGRFFGTRGT